MNIILPFITIPTISYITLPLVMGSDLSDKIKVLTVSTLIYCVYLNAETYVRNIELAK